MAERTITLKTRNNTDEYRFELKATEAITPGHLSERVTATTVRKHATAGGDVDEVLVAVEDDLQGNDISDAYAADDRVQLNHFGSGDEVYMWLADGENVAFGDQLESNGDGTLRKAIAQTVAASADDDILTKRIVSTAMEAKDLSASSNTAAGRIKVRIR
jgi:hypothetical protein